jgi:hypothetical protein
MTNIIRIALGTSVALLGLGTPAFAQSAPVQTTTTQTTQTTTTDVTGPHSPYCGSYVNGTWTPNGNCVVETTTVTTTPATTAMTPENGGVARIPQRVTGTITSVKGHLVTLQQSTQSLVVDDSRALNRQETGKVAVGRAITAHGYWEGGTFYANRFETMPTDTKDTH